MAGDCKEKSDLYASTLIDDNSINTHPPCTTCDGNDLYTEEGGKAEQSLGLKENGELLPTKIEVVTTNVLSSSSLNDTWTLVIHRRNSRKQDNNSKLISKLPFQGSEVVIKKKEHGMRKDTPKPRAFISKVKVLRYPLYRFTKYSDQLLDKDISGLKAKNSGIETDDCKLRVNVEHLTSGADRMDKKNTVKVGQIKSPPMQSSAVWNKETLLLVLFLCIMAVQRSNSGDPPKIPFYRERCSLNFTKVVFGKATACFKMSTTNKNDWVTFDDAVKACKMMGSKLAEPSFNEWEALKKQVFPQRRNAPWSFFKGLWGFYDPRMWLGIIKREGRFRYLSDDWLPEESNWLNTASYAPWSKRNPSGDGVCVEAGYVVAGRSDKDNDWLWNDRNCSGRAFYVCQNGCSSLFTRVANVCYKFQSNRRLFDQAADECKKMGAELAQPSFTQYPELYHFIFPKNLQYGIWMGIKNQGDRWAYLSADKPSDWLNSHAARYWSPGNPNGDGNCVEAVRNLGPATLHHMAAWNDRPCRDSNYFACERGLIETDHYYHKLEGTANWADARSKCKKLFGILPEPRNTEEDEKLKTFLSKHGVKKGVWMGSRVWRKGYQEDAFGNFKYPVIWKWDSDGHVVGKGWASNKPDFKGGSDTTGYCMQYCLDINGWDSMNCWYKGVEIVCQLKRYEADKYYVHLDGKASWDDAKAKCEQVNGRLPEPRSIEENEQMKTFANDHGIQGAVWMGSRKHTRHEPWTWYSDGHHILINDWAPDEPNYRYGPPFCMMYWMKRHAWDDYECPNPNEIICQLHKPECPTGFELHGALCYKCLVCGLFNDAGASWDVAKSKCEAIEARLVEPKTKEQYDAMATMLSKHEFEGDLWVGGHQNDGGDYWMWDSNKQEIWWILWCKGRDWCPNQLKPRSKDRRCLTYVDQHYDPQIEPVIGMSASPCRRKFQILCETEMIMGNTKKTSSTASGSSKKSDFASDSSAAQGNVMPTLVVVIMSIYAMCHVSMD